MKVSADYRMLALDTAHPFILENNALMDGWRILDHSAETNG